MSDDPSLFKFIFNDETKHIILNHMQIVTISFIPFLILTRILDFIPESNNTKGVLEIIFEIILQILILILGIIIIIKFTMYFTPWSGRPYPSDFAFAPFILAVLLIMIIFNSKLSEKLDIVKEKIMNKIKPENTKPQTQTQTQSHSLTRQLQLPQTQPQTQPLTQPQTNQPTQQLPNYDQMYQNQPIDTFEPTAANESYGGFGTSF